MDDFGAVITSSDYSKKSEDVLGVKHISVNKCFIFSYHLQ